LTNGAPQLQRSAMITVRCFFFAFLMAWNKVARVQALHCGPICGFHGKILIELGRLG
jgi:hypothetical protein